MVERTTELHCHECGQWVQFRLDEEVDGQHEIVCPVCGHIHYRIVENGRITDIRYRSSMQTYQCYVTGTTSASMYATCSSASASTTELWMTMSDSGNTGSW